MSWIYLVLAGLLEIGFTTCLKMSESFSKPLPSIGFLIFAFLSFFMLTKALEGIPLGTAYAVWTGIGACGTAIIGIWLFGDPAGTLRLLFLLLLIGSIIGLKVVS
ncbi:multidrug efflux SMR transporter [Methylobacillus gramineus]|uniref:DMT family transporter n=1 Tax=Methylobacillus gramineus TaxID=755169 RepID=UPI001CFF6AD5|nr:multidrug efflux SMR transporter [Methylobacillus gramineus]MCB5183917.1 multidrug efflux SMR transporter [Methylobacillus gramineus]